MQLRHSPGLVALLLFACGGAEPEVRSAPAASVATDGRRNACAFGEGSGAVAFEAESGLLLLPFRVQRDPGACGGAFVDSHAGTDRPGRAVYKLGLPVAGEYSIWARVQATSNSTNSFHVAVNSDDVDNHADDGSSTIWDVLPLTEEWRWLSVTYRASGGSSTDARHEPRRFKLPAGEHLLYLTQREPETRIDRLVVTSDPNLAPD